MPLSSFGEGSVMGSPRYDPDHLLFAVLPYVAVVAFLVLVAVRRFRPPPSGTPPQPTPRHYGERFLFGYGILVILGGHVLAFLIPEQVLLWNNDALRRYVLEVSALVFALMTLAGLLLTAARCLFSAEARRGVGPSDWLLYALLLLQVVSGIYVALFYPWGSSWYATLVVPYLRSLVRLEPDLSAIGALPHAFTLHLVTACVLVMFLPFTRVVRPLIAPDGEEGQGRAAGRVATTMLLVGLAVSLLALVPRLWGVHLPGNQQGYEPAQPIAFSHRLHAGELQVSCLYCHADAEKGRHAGIASASVCMNCHRFATAPTRDVRAELELAKEEKRPPRTIISPELAKLYKALGLDEKLQPDPARPTTPIRWVRVHNLPSFTRFDHRAHVNGAVACQRCHGPVETMERVRQVEDLSMGWCVQCHRDAQQNGVAGHGVRPSNDCTTCHH
jgi:respiratory nitrate reductase gamma subunit